MSTPRTHPLNVSYLVVGLVFLGIAASWVLRETGVVDLSEVRWLLPLTLVLAGLVGVVAMAVKGLRPQAGPPSGTRYDEGPDDYYEGDAR